MLCETCKHLSKCDNWAKVLPLHINKFQNKRIKKKKYNSSSRRRRKGNEETEIKWLLLSKLHLKDKQLSSCDTLFFYRNLMTISIYIYLHKT